MSFMDMAQLITAIAALGGMTMGVVNSLKIKEVHISINSRMDQLLKAAAEAAHAAGAAQEKSEAAALISRSGGVEGKIIVPEQTLKIETPREK